MVLASYAGLEILIRLDQI